MCDAPGACAHRCRIGEDLYQPPRVKYGSIGKQKVPRMACVKSAAYTFHGPLGGRFQAVLRSLAAMSDWFSIVTGLENTYSRSVMYQVVKLELSNFGALVLSPAASSQNHMTDFFKTVPTRNLTGSTRRLSAVHEGRRYTPSATASSYASQQFRGPILRC